MSALFINPNGASVTVAQIVDATDFGKALLATDAPATGNQIFTYEFGTVTVIEMQDWFRTLLSFEAPASLDSFLIVTSGQNPEWQQIGITEEHHPPGSALTTQNGVIIQFT